MQRVYLSELLPETAIIKSRMGADVRQKLEAHEKERKDYKNVCPEVTFFPMAKYDVTKNQTQITEKERDAQLLAVGGVNEEGTANQPDFLARLKNAAEGLPQRSRVKARKLLPHLLAFEDLLGGGEIDLQGILYDLTVENAKGIKTMQRETLASITRQLESNSAVDKRLFYKKITEKQQHKQSVRSPGHPIKSKNKSWQKLSAEYFSKFKPEDEVGAGSSSTPTTPATPSRRKKKSLPRGMQWN
jgi:hypothetical protein